MEKSKPPSKDLKTQSTLKAKKASIIPATNAKDMNRPGKSPLPSKGTASVTKSSTMRNSNLNNSYGGRRPMTANKGESLRVHSPQKLNRTLAGQKTKDNAQSAEVSKEKSDAVVKGSEEKKIEPKTDGTQKQGPPESLDAPSTGDSPALTKKASGQSEAPTAEYKSFLKAPSATKEVITGNVRVFCRFRPLNERELLTTENEVCVTFKDEKTCSVMGINKQTGNQEPIDYTFDATYDPDKKQKDLYDTAVLPVIDSVLEGFNGTILAYGQTGSGKTHTMLGPDIDDEEEKGIIPRMVSGIFAKIESAAEEIEFTVQVSMVEIYNEKIRDLLDPKKNNLKIHENKDQGIYVKDMTESYVGGEDEVFSLLKIGNENRSIGSTDMNKQSSRSHSVFILTIEQKNTVDFSSRTGKIYLVDLAGSERIAKTGAQGQTLDEAKNINKSLTCLGQVINALTDGKSTHIPYRDSKLTRILQESLGGNSRTSLIVTCSPSVFNENETVSTLRFGQRAKQIKNKARVNKEFSIQELKYMLQMAEKEIIIKTKKIEALEAYITEFQLTGKADPTIIEQVQKKMELEQKKIEKAMALEMLEEQKIETDTQQESESHINESSEDEEEEEVEVQDIESSPMIVSSVGRDPVPSFLRESVLEMGDVGMGDTLNENMLRVDSLIADVENPDPDAQLDEQIRKNRNQIERVEVLRDVAVIEMDDTLEEQKVDESQQLTAIQETQEQEESIQSVNEEELIDQHGEFIIFANPASNPNNNVDGPLANAELMTDASLNSDTHIAAQLQALGVEGLQQKIADPTNLLEANFSKLNYVNKINILLKALMIERNKNSESGIKNQVMKREYITKVKKIVELQDENEQLIEKVAQGEIQVEQKQDEVSVLKKKHVEDKFRIEQMYDKNKSLEEVLNRTEETKQDEVKQMETRIENRVQKIIAQKQEIMKQEKKLILEKYRQYEKKIKDQRQQLRDAHGIIQKQKQIGLEEKGDSFQNTLNKLINSEKNLDQLKLMYHQLASSKEVMKKDLVILDKKYKRSQQKIKSYDNELKQTRQQVSTFKLKFKSLTEFIRKKGGLEVLNNLPNAPNQGISGSLGIDQGVTQGNIDDISSSMPMNSARAVDNMSSAGSVVKKSIRGGLITNPQKESALPKIRGGGGRRESMIGGPGPSQN